MANKNAVKEIRFDLSDEDYKEFGRYRILYTPNGKKIVNKQRLTYAVSGIVIAILFTVFHVDSAFTKLAYVVAAVIAVGGVLFAEKIILRQQNKVIEADMNSADRVHAAENVVKFSEEGITTVAGADEQHFTYGDIKQVDMTESAIYVWMSDTMIMPLPLHAFSGQKAMEDMYNWLNERMSTKKSNAQ